MIKRTVLCYGRNTAGHKALLKVYALQKKQVRKEVIRDGALHAGSIAKGA